MPNPTAAERAVAHRRTRLRLWIGEFFGGVQSKFIAHCAITRNTHINQGELSGLLKNKSFGEKKARALEVDAGMPENWLDNDQPIPRPQASSAVIATDTDPPQYADDTWSREAAMLIRKLPPHQREGAIANLRTYIQNLGPPSNGQALPVAA